MSLRRAVDSRRFPPVRSFTSSRDAKPVPVWRSFLAYLPFWNQAASCQIPHDRV